MKAILLLWIAILMAGCSISFGGGSTETRVVDSGIITQDGFRWNCIITKQDYEQPESIPWRRVRKGVCYEVKP